MFEETFGSAEQPEFVRDASLAVDQSSGDLLVVDIGSGAKTISRWRPDGTPSPFADLGTNVIDGEGSGGGPGSGGTCTPPSPECDETELNGLAFRAAGSGAKEVQVAVDNSGTVTDGNIYVTQASQPLGSRRVEIFSGDGEWLGSLTEASGVSFGAREPCGVGVDASGAVYVGVFGAPDRVHKFVPSGNPPTNGDHVASFDSLEGQSSPCTLAAGIGPTAGSLFVNRFNEEMFKLDSATGEKAYAETEEGLITSGVTTVSVDPVSGRALVATGTEVQEWDASEEDAPPAQPFVTVAAGGTVEGVAADEASERLYVARAGTSMIDVYGPVVLTPAVVTGGASNLDETTATLNGTVDPEGAEVTECLFEYVADADYQPEAPEPYAAGETASCAESSAEIGSGDEPVAVHADISGLQPGTEYHFRLLAANAAGSTSGLDETFITHAVPLILEEEVLAVTETEATIRARINPRHFTTSFRIEYGLTPDHGKSTASLPVGADDSPHLVRANLRGLQSGATYHFQVVATNEHGSSKGPDRSFATYRPFAAETDCPNQSLRTAAAAFLPDCRGYEMVSPVDKNGGDIITANADSGDHAGYMQSSRDGNRITYSAVGASFAGQPNSFAINQYLAHRRGEGWSSEGVHPPVSGKTVGGGIFFGLSRQFMAFTPDLCSAWLVDNQTPPAVSSAVEGYANLYRRQSCGAGAGSFEALTTVEPPEGSSVVYVNNQSVQGVTESGRRAFFVARGKLTEDASGALTTGGFPIAQIYAGGEGGAIELASVLPDGSASPNSSAVGSGWQGNLDGATAADGSWLYWSSEGSIYLRRHPAQGIVAGECSTPERACTVGVSEGGGAFFWAAAADGSRALYSEGSLEGGNATLHFFDRASGESQLIAEKLRGVAGASEDLARIYFVSEEDLSEGAQDGEPNLYLLDEGAVTFIATLLPGDVGVNEPGTSFRAYDLVARNSLLRATRVTPDGSHIAFNSRAGLTNYDNTDTASGRPAVEVYLYEAGGELACASCNPSGARPRGSREMPEPPFPFRSVVLGKFETKVFAAAWIPGWEHPLHASNILSEDGSRLFFNSNDALVPRDANGAQDLYEWEAPGTGSCTTQSASYFPRNGGCLYLISSAESSYESEFWEASPDGEDVFFTTNSSLVGKDPGLVDLYDARVGGGFPEPVEPAACEGEACQSPPPPPEFGTPSSRSYRAPGNPPQARSCRPAARRALRHSRRARRTRRAARRAEAPARARRLRRRSAGFAKRAKRASGQAKRCRRVSRRAQR